MNSDKAGTKKSADTKSTQATRVFSLFREDQRALGINSGFQTCDGAAKVREVAYSYTAETPHDRYTGVTETEEKPEKQQTDSSD